MSQVNLRQTQPENWINSPFLDSVTSGLLKRPKTLSSRYFYDDRGSELFAQIMNLPEYYLSDCEMQILQTQSGQIVETLAVGHQSLDVVELGAGDGSKTVHLLKALLNKFPGVTYRPIDISQGALDALHARLRSQLPSLNTESLCGDYFEKLSQLKSHQSQKLLLFIGSNLGNMSDPQASEFLINLSHSLNPSDYLLLGLDLIKDQSIVLPAYSDSSGVTAEFNLNLLDRINRELGGDFDRRHFSHVAEYTRAEGVARSYLQSLCDQTVTIGANGTRIHFSAMEKVSTEISRKYDTHVLKSLIKNSGFELVQTFTDSRGYFADFLLQKR